MNQITLPPRQIKLILSEKSIDEIILVLELHFEKHENESTAKLLELLKSMKSFYSLMDTIDDLSKQV